MTVTTSPARDSGTAGIETAVALTALLLVVFFAVGAIRITGTSGDVGTAARAAARAAATGRTSSAGNDLATAVATRILADRGVACNGGPSIDADGAGVPGGAVTVTVTCQVDLGDVAFAGFPGVRTVTASATEYVDSIRGSS